MEPLTERLAGIFRFITTHPDYRGRGVRLDAIGEYMSRTRAVAYPHPVRLPSIQRAVDKLQLRGLVYCIKGGSHRHREETAHPRVGPPRSGANANGAVLDLLVRLETFLDKTPMASMSQPERLQFLREISH